MTGLPGPMTSRPPAVPLQPAFVAPPQNAPHKGEARDGGMAAGWRLSASEPIRWPGRGKGAEDGPPGNVRSEGPLGHLTTGASRWPVVDDAPTTPYGRSPGGSDSLYSRHLSERRAFGAAVQGRADGVNDIGSVGALRGQVEQLVLITAPSVGKARSRQVGQRTWINGTSLFPSGALCWEDVGVGVDLDWGDLRGGVGF